MSNTKRYRTCRLRNGTMNPPDIPGLTNGNEWRIQTYDRCIDDTKRHDNKMVRFTTEFGQGKYIFVKCLPLTTTVAKRLAAESYLDLHPSQLGPCQFKSVGPAVVRIMQNGIENNVGSIRMNHSSPPVWATAGNGNRKNNERNDRHYG